MNLLRDLLTKKGKTNKPDQRQSYFLLHVIETVCAASKPEEAEDLAEMTFQCLRNMQEWH